MLLDPPTGQEALGTVRAGEYGATVRAAGHPGANVVVQAVHTVARSNDSCEVVVGMNVSFVHAYTLPRTLPRLEARVSGGALVRDPSSTVKKRAAPGPSACCVDRRRMLPGEGSDS
jgi:hypothetical protein